VYARHLALKNIKNTKTRWSTVTTENEIAITLKLSDDFKEL